MQFDLILLYKNIQNIFMINLSEYIYMIKPQLLLIVIRKRSTSKEP